MSPKKKFKMLHAEWLSERSEVSSNITQLCTHPAYQKIIGMGKDALPFIFHELENDLDHWFWALNAITCCDPVEEKDKGRMSAMRDAWLRWAQDCDL